MLLTRPRAPERALPKQGLLVIRTDLLAAEDLCALHPRHNVALIAKGICPACGGVRKLRQTGGTHRRPQLVLSTHPHRDVAAGASGACAGSGQPAVRLVAWQAVYRDPGGRQRSRTVGADRVDEELLASNPCRRVRVPPARSGRPAVMLAPGEAIALLGELPDLERVAALTMLGTGLRTGEAVGLRRGDVDLLRGLLHVRDQIRHERGGQRRRPLKTASSERTVPLPAAVVAGLAAHLPRGGETGDLVFTGLKGGLLSRNDYPKRLRTAGVRAAAALGSSREDAARLARLAPKDLRSTYASWLADAGVPLPAIDEALGHARGGSVTERYYLFALPEVARRVTGAVDERLAGLTPPPARRASRRASRRSPADGAG